MNNNYKVAIVGGGASGLMCAMELLNGSYKLNGQEIVIIERNDRVGKKLIATGNSQGNLTNSTITKENYHGDKDFINAFFRNSASFDAEKYLNTFGIYLETDNEGRKYPISRRASSVLDIFMEFLKSKGCKIITGQKVENIKRDIKSDLYKVSSQDSVYFAQKVVIAVGGKSGKQYGTDGSSYNLSTQLGHNLTPLYPSLVQLKTDTKLIKGLAGIKEFAKCTAVNGSTELMQSVGDILFTEYGVSGSAVFKISGSLTDKQNAKLKIEFLPNISFEKLTEILKFREELGIYQGDKILNGLINKKLASIIYKTAKSTEINDIAFSVKNFYLDVKGSLGFDYSQVTKGGIQTKHINPLTFESKISRGVYIIGETLDIDGDCGGYNLNFAFASGYYSAINIKKIFSEKGEGNEI